MQMLMTKLLKQMFPTVFNFSLSITIGIQMRTVLLQQKNTRLYN